MPTEPRREKGYIEAVIGLLIGAAAAVYIWQWWSGQEPAAAPLATLPGAASSPYPQAVTGRSLRLYVAR